LCPKDKTVRRLRGQSAWLQLDDAHLKGKGTIAPVRLLPPSTCTPLALIDVDPETFIAAVTGARSWAEAMRTLGVNRSSHSYRRIRDAAAAAGIAVAGANHPCGHCGRPIRLRNKFCSLSCDQAHRLAVRLENWLRTGEISGADPADSIRQYLLDEQKSKCAICAGSNEWTGKVLVFVLDHIDGNSANNCRENLRMVCPNCDSQLETYKGRNHGNGRFARRQRYAAGGSY
jgi:hypothetical protein